MDLQSRSRGLARGAEHRLHDRPPPPTERDALTAAIVRAAADEPARVVVGGAAEWTAPDDRDAWHG